MLDNYSLWRELTFHSCFFFFCLCCVLSLASMARLLESQENQGRLIREYERTRDIAANQAMNE